MSGGRRNNDWALDKLISSAPGEARAKGVGAFERQRDVTDLYEIGFKDTIEEAIKFATILSGSCAIELSSDPNGGFNRLAIPFMVCPCHPSGPTLTQPPLSWCPATKEEGPDVNFFIKALQETVYAIARQLDPSKIDGIRLEAEAHQHKKEILSLIHI